MKIENNRSVGSLLNFWVKYPLIKKLVFLLLPPEDRGFPKFFGVFLEMLWGYIKIPHNNLQNLPTVWGRAKAIFT